MYGIEQPIVCQMKLFISSTAILQGCHSQIAKLHVNVAITQLLVYLVSLYYPCSFFLFSGPLETSQRTLAHQIQTLVERCTFYTKNEQCIKL